MTRRSEKRKYIDMAAAAVEKLGHMTHGTRLRSLADFLGVNKSSVYRWYNGETVPERYNRRKILDRLIEFGVKHDEVITARDLRIKEITAEYQVQLDALATDANKSITALRV